MMIPMENVEQKLKDLADAWQAFKTVAHEADQGQRQAFTNMLKEMDMAEMKVVRADVLKQYDE